MNHRPIIVPQFSQKTPDNVLELAVSSIKNLQIGYHGETIFLYPAEGTSLIIKEYIGGLFGTEYYAKISSNRIKTTIRYGRREEINQDTYIEVFLPVDWHGELSLSSQYGNILADTDWKFERFAAETTEGFLSLKGIEAPRIHMATSVSPIVVEKAEGFADLHSVSGSITVKEIAGGAKLETSGGDIYTVFSSLNNIVECATLNGSIDLVLPAENGMKVDGISKTGSIYSDIEGLSIKTKPGNIQNITGMLGETPFQDVKISTINGNITLHQ